MPDDTDQQPVHHGSTATFQVGDRILAPVFSGIRHRDMLPRDHYRVFVTTVYEKAVFYAVSRALFLGTVVGKVYRVEPEGVLTPDPNDYDANPPKRIPLFRGMRPGSDLAYP